MAWNKRDAHPIGDKIEWVEHRWEKGHMIPQWVSSGTWGGASGCTPRMMGPDHKYRNGFGSGKGKYQFAVCGKRFGSYASIGYYPELDAWAHMGCIVRDMARRDNGPNN